MRKWRCPEGEPFRWQPSGNSGHTGEVISGCGAVFEVEPDDEGLIECPICGMWWDPRDEPETEVKDAGNLSARES